MMRMTYRERIMAILRREKPDRVPWFGDLDYWATAKIKRGEFSADFKMTSGYLDWHRELGVGYYLQGQFPFRAIRKNCTIEEWQEGFKRFRRITTPKGVLRECWQYLPQSFAEGPVEHLIKSETDLPALRYLYDNTRYEPDYAFIERRLQQVGDMGIVLCYLPRSPFMHLVVEDAGIEAVAFAALCAPDELSETLEVMERRFDQAAEIALNSSAEVFMIPENLSAEMIGPRFFEKYMRPYQEKWAKRISASGKYSFIHMDGTLKALLREEASTGIDVLEALTPAPVGDVSIHDLAELASNPRTILWGGIPGVYLTPSVCDEEFDRHVREVLEVMRREPRYVLGVADQVPPDALEYRVKRVSQLVEECGVY